MTDATKVLVTDTNCKDAPRTHSVMVGDSVVDVTFQPGEPLELEASVGMKFLVDPAFVVQNHDGRTLRGESKPDSAGRVDLAPDQVIAYLDELAVDALVKRCKMIPGGENKKKQDGKDSLIAFLTGKSADAPIEDDDPEEPEEMDDDDVDRLFEGGED